MNVINNHVELQKSQLESVIDKVKKRHSMTQKDVTSNLDFLVQVGGLGK